MTDKPKASSKEDDPNQSEAFKKAVRDLEAAGELDSERGEIELERILKGPKAR